MVNGHAYRFSDNGHCIGHDEPSVKFISSTPGAPTRMESDANFCFANRFQNGDLDFDGTSYQRNTWPNGPRGARRPCPR